MIGIRTAIAGSLGGGQSWASYWASQPEVLFFGLYSDIADGQMPNRKSGSSDYLTVAGTEGSETYQCPNTASYITADRDFIWFDGVGNQRAVTTAELVGYDLQRSPVKYEDILPNAIVAIIILNSNCSGTQRDKMFTDMWLPIMWDNSLNAYGHVKDNRGAVQILFDHSLKQYISVALSNIDMRESGGNNYVSKIYDITNYANNYFQIVEVNQPLLENIGIAFDGTNHFLEGGNKSSLDFTTAFTYVGWAKTLDHTKINQQLFCHGITDGQRSISISFALHHGITPVEMSVLFYVTPDGTQTNRAYIIPADGGYGQVVSDNTWYFIACIYDNSAIPKMKLYIQNVLYTVTTIGTPPTSIYTGSTENETIAKGFNNLLIGSIDFQKLFNVALTETQMTKIFNDTKSRYGY